MYEKLVVRKIREIRHNSNITLKELATKTGLTTGYLSKIENGNKIPPIPTLERIAQSLDIDISFLFFQERDCEGKNPNLIVIRHDDYQKRILELKLQSENGYDKYRYEPLARGKPRKNMQPYVVVLGFNASKTLQHEGEEFHYVLEGALEFFYGSEKYILTKGDCVYFDAKIPHSGKSIGDQQAEVLVIIYSYKKM